VSPKVSQRSCMGLPAALIVPASRTALPPKAASDGDNVRLHVLTDGDLGSVGARARPGCLGGGRGRGARGVAVVPVVEGRLGARSTWAVGRQDWPVGRESQKRRQLSVQKGVRQSAPKLPLPQGDRARKPKKISISMTLPPKEKMRSPARSSS